MKTVDIETAKEKTITSLISKVAPVLFPAVFVVVAAAPIRVLDDVGTDVIPAVLLSIVEISVDGLVEDTFVLETDGVGLAVVETILDVVLETLEVVVTRDERLVANSVFVALKEDAIWITLVGTGAMVKL